MSPPRLPVEIEADPPKSTSNQETEGYGAGETAQGDSVGSIGEYQYLRIADLQANRSQPRQDFDEKSLAGLAESIRVDGVMQPVIARRLTEGQYELIAGERRWRAAQLAGLADIPAVIRDLSERESAEWALIENLQREDLNPIERAEAFQGLADTHQLSHDDIARRVGLERSTVTNLLRLLKLAPEVRGLVRRDLLSMGHSRIGGCG